MIDASSEFQDGSADQYVLLKLAWDVAAGAGDAPTAIRATEQLAQRFDVLWEVSVNDCEMTIR